MKLEALVNKKVLILGFGREGKATRAFLKHYFPEMIVGAADQNDGPDYLKEQEKYDLAIRTPGIPKRLVTIPSTTATNIFFANAPGTTIGITGSKGKSTTASLIYAILKEAGLKSHLAGNIGTPLLQELIVGGSTSNNGDGGGDARHVWVCEISSYQLDDIEYSPHISVILNLFPEHMDYHGSVNAYREAKKRIVAKATPADYFVYNPAYPELAALAETTRAKAVPFIETLPFPDSSIPLIGAHNKENVRAAATVANILGISPETVERAVRGFTPLPHRLEKVGTFSSITFYDDAISTAPESTIEAIKALPKISTIFLGGLNRGYDFSSLAETILRYKIPSAVLFPESGRAILEACVKAGVRFRHVLETSDMAEAVEFAYAHSSPGTVCLLSTASPSYTLWKNFEEKGDAFQRWVRVYAQERLGPLSR